MRSHLSPSTRLLHVLYFASIFFTRGFATRSRPSAYFSRIMKACRKKTSGTQGDSNQPYLFSGTFLYYFKVGLLRVGPAPPTNSPTIQRTVKQKPHIVQTAVPEVSKMVIGGGSYEEDPCVICHEDMNASGDIVTLECGHRYHSPVRFVYQSIPTAVSKIVDTNSRSTFSCPSKRAGGTVEKRREEKGPCSFL